MHRQRRTASFAGITRQKRRPIHLVHIYIHTARYRDRETESDIVYVVCSRREKLIQCHCTRRLEVACAGPENDEKFVRAGFSVYKNGRTESIECGVHIARD